MAQERQHTRRFYESKAMRGEKPARNPRQCPAMANGRCRLHGGLSTGPKTAEGIERFRRAVTKHGRYTKAATLERTEIRDLFREARTLLKTIHSRTWDDG